uniref:Uncharacterized protein n=1 Tax=Photinus pyralis TaxID=7054 RepID=A0A1Y1LRJ2_PHOPY
MNKVLLFLCICLYMGQGNMQWLSRGSPFVNYRIGDTNEETLGSPIILVPRNHITVGLTYGYQRDAKGNPAPIWDIDKHYPPSKPSYMPAPQPQVKRWPIQHNGVRYGINAKGQRAPVWER